MTEENTLKQLSDEKSVRAIDLVAQRTATLNQKLLLHFGESRKLFGPIPGLRQSIGGTLAETLRQTKVVLQPLPPLMRPVSLPLGLQHVMQRSYPLTLHQRLAPMFGEVSRALKELPAKIREGLVALAHAGWYLDPEMPITAITKFREKLDNKPISEIQEGLASYFRERLVRIEGDLRRRHPERAKLIGSAFSAHRSGNYDASIPLLFAQVDGITDDIADSNLFRKGLNGYVSKADLKDFGRAYLDPLLQQIPVNFTQRRRGEDFAQLNRHAVMHGEALDYGTEENGLKAISLLNYVSYVLSDDQPEDQ